MLLSSISFAANLPIIFVVCRAIAAWAIATGPYGINDKPLVKGANIKLIFFIKLKDEWIPICVIPNNILFKDKDFKSEK